MRKKLVLNSLIVLSFFALSFAYFVEFILGHEPCSLCKVERIPYIGAIIFCSLLFYKKRRKSNSHDNFFALLVWSCRFNLPCWN